MGLDVMGVVKRIVYVEPKERLKLLFLAISYFLIITAYTVAKEFKDSVFVNIVGKSYVPTAKIVAMFALIPAIFIYSRLVDKIRRYQLLSLYSFVFGALGLVFTYFLGHPTIGLPNTNISATRLFGWVFYVFVEGYSPFVVSVFWAFANSINTPDSAKKNYGLLVSGSKLGGMLSAGLGWFVFTSSWIQHKVALSDVGMHQLVYGVSSLALLLVPVAVLLLMRKVSGRYLHGYEAAYKIEKRKAKAERKQDSEKEPVTGTLFSRMRRSLYKLFSGFILLVRYPYVFGIFCMVFFYEAIATILSFLRLSVAQAGANSMGAFTGNLFKLIFISHSIGFVISLVGTSALLRILGERLCLLLIPLSSGLFALYMIFTGFSPASVGLAFIAMKAIHYAFSWPVRESLYIPTVKEIKFKSKSWIDAFGSKFAKAFGSVLNIGAAHITPVLLMPFYTVVFGALVGVWTVAAWLLGYRFDRAVAENEVIGAGEYEMTADEKA